MIIHNQPMSVYLADPGFGSHTARDALKSPQLARDGLDAGVHPASGAQQLGTLIHMMRLEPERFAQCVVADGPINERTGKPYGRDTGTFAAWQAANPQITVVEPWVRTLLDRCPDEVAALFVGGNSEVSVYRDMDALGYRIKARPDYLAGTLIVDVKTCQDVDRAERDISRYGYWFQHAWYRMVMKEETDRPHRFRFVFAEKKPPFRWRVVDLDADYQLWADDQVEKAMGLLCDCVRNNDWSDRGDLFVMASRPDYFDDAEDDSDTDGEAA